MLIMLEISCGSCDNTEEFNVNHLETNGFPGDTFEPVYSITCECCGSIASWRTMWEGSRKDLNVDG